MVFYRKYRPQKFNEMVGQEHIVQTLANALSSSSFSHGYLFAGPKGSGKTTLARILAKALNCTGRELGKDSFEPCNKCKSCKEIIEGKSLDIIEIDAASNRGIDEIRDLREKIRFAPTSSKYKIYIIDEVHMLTKEAFNALLKTLEEPPKHAIFVMATTEPQKILPTILSRVQRFDFHRATIKEIEKLIKKVTLKEEIKIDDDVIHLLGQLSFGSFRDALSLLSQVVSVRQTQASRITLEKTQSILGISSEKSVFDFVKFLIESERKKAFELISQLYLQGIDMENFTVKVIEILRKILLFKFGEDQLFDLTKEQQEEAKKMAESLESDKLILMIEKFVVVLSQIKTAALPQLPLEMAVFELTQEEKEEIRNEKCEMGEKKINITNIKNDEKIEVKSVPHISHLTSRRTSFSQDLWLKIIKEAKTHNNHIAALLKDAVLAGTDDGEITLAFKFKFHADMVAGKRNTQVVEQIIEKITGKNYKVLCVVNPELAIKKPIDTEEELLDGAKEIFEVED